MSLVQSLREFINERLTTAAGEIFTVFEQTIARFEEEIVCQRKLLKISEKPQIKLHRTESPQQHIGHQKTSSSLEQEEHEAPHIKEEEDVIEVTVADGESDNSLDSVRELTTQRLTVAAGEIFTVFEQTIVQYEEEIDRQRRLLEIIWKPQVKLHRTELPQHHNCREGQLFNQETNYCQEPEEPELSQIKEEPEEPGLLQFKEEPEEAGLLHFKEQQELGTSQGGGQLILKFKSDSFRVPSVEEQSSLSQPEKVSDTERLLSHDSGVQDVNKHLDSESTRNAELKKICIFHSYCVDISVSEKQAEGEKLLYEETCGEIVRKKCKLRGKVGTATDKKRILCEICGKSYALKQCLVVHMRTHTGEKPYSCETCGKSFSQKCNLLSHMQIHKNEKPYSCETCGRRFSHKHYLLVHLRTHTGEKPYSCETCGTSFCQPNSLVVHKRIHTGEKPYSCETCGKSFGAQSHLSVHKRTHTGEKPYCCKACGKCFIDQSGLFHHNRNHTGEKPYSCETCGKRFGIRSNLLTHKRTHR